MLHENRDIRKVILATGGSGGHIFPAVAVFETLTKKGYKVSIISDDAYEKYVSLNYNYDIIPAGKSLKNITSIKNIFFGVLGAIKILKQKTPDLVVGFGCYATLPTLLACILTKTPFILHEQNVCVGKVNNFFSRYALKVMTSYPEIYGIKYRNADKIVYTGYPVRDDLLNKQTDYILRDDIFVISIIGGSLGAKFFSNGFCKIFDKQILKQKNIFVYHQVQEEYIRETKIHYQSIGLNAEVSPFFPNMSEILSKTHLMISRSGNGILAEISIYGIPAILIPLSTSANDHQLKNAKLYQKDGATIVVEEKDFQVESFQKLLFGLIGSREKLEQMSRQLKKQIKMDANNNIFDIIDKTIDDFKR
ncbi:MAG: UDP-N-acetylglucosamine--N-acetylmuramyl-(pentapeptide) pyrophosphoryl-undecaprenol N-acetylglucosamine transferase [Rickettsiales bacterium]|jgi:UDP-N-acetylglucosamine--N-acetylmuramyl-(pentapeptide) pyrophosphoryl-undecaprenol N-acetylglucosamine transferase|nr:UDP-N-acetylglucosamine--N-acetylmuramyl-(pentapeptide) pyrophosphoryl-undecaprenol N-acetylglucosamine transferase [Rickettsiales bacterium]